MIRPAPRRPGPPRCCGRGGEREGWFPFGPDFKGAPPWSSAPSPTSFSSIGICPVGWARPLVQSGSRDEASCLER